MAYIHLLGYEIDTGYMEVINLLSSTKYAEKVVGYVAISLLITSSHEFATLVVNSMRVDLLSQEEQNSALALATIANMGGQEFAEAVYEDVLKMVTDDATKDSLRKRAANCLMSLYRSAPDSVSCDWAEDLVKLLDNPDLGVVTAAANLYETIPRIEGKGLIKLLRSVVDALIQLVIDKKCPPQYMFRDIPSPWLTIKMLKILEKYDYPDGEKKLCDKITKVLNSILNDTEISDKDRNKNNAKHAILFEGINVVIHYGEESEAKLRKAAVKFLGSFISDTDSNVRYLALDSLARLASLEGTNTVIQKHKATILESLDNPDVSIRKRAVHVLFAMCDENCAEEIVKELLDYLGKADYHIKSEMILKIAILAEKFAKDFYWYMDVMLQMITTAGEFVSDDIWYRTVQIISQHEELHSYAVKKLFEALQPDNLNESLIRCGCYVVGEYGNYLNDDETETEPDLIFETLVKHMKHVGSLSKALIIHAVFKLMNVYPDLKDSVNDLFEQYKADMDPEIQQRVVEYTALMEDEDIMAEVMDAMPAFPEKASLLVARLEKLMHPDESKEKGEEEPEEGEEEEEEGGEEEEQEEGDEDEEEDGEVDQTPFLKKCLVSPKGVLFENGSIQIGIEHKYKGDLATVTLHYINKSSSDISDLSVSISSKNKGVLVQDKGVEDSIESGSEVVQQIQLKLAKPFVDFPDLAVSYTAKSSVELELKLPVCLYSFGVPAKMAGPAFMTHWNGLAGKEITKSIPGGDSSIITKQLPNMRFGVSPGDGKPNTVYGALSLKAGANTIGIMVAIECGKKYNVTVRAPMPDICKGIFSGIQAVIGN